MSVFDTAGRPKIAYNPTTRTVTFAATFASQIPLIVGVNDVYLSRPVAGTITGVTLLTSGGPASCVVDIWKVAYGSFPPTVSNSICASALPTISTGIDYSDNLLSGWTTQINAGDVLAFHLKATAGFNVIICELTVQQ